MTVPLTDAERAQLQQTLAAAQSAADLLRSKPGARQTVDQLRSSVTLVGRLLNAPDPPNRSDRRKSPD